ncbi:MAG: hypothetical protein ACXVRW_18760 [Solirubrobacteraceae bacterium]
MGYFGEDLTPQCGSCDNRDRGLSEDDEERRARRRRRPAAASSRSVPPRGAFCVCKSPSELLRRF